MMWDDDGGRWGTMHDSGAGWLMLVLMVVLVAAVVVAAIALLRGWSPATSTHAVAGTRPGDPRAILQERLARGEIDEQDYRTRMRALDDAGS